MELTPTLNQNNIESVRKYIGQKISWKPFFANNLDVTNSVTDFDHHPYSRWYRGVYYYPDPIVLEREAGWRPQEQQCYNPNYIPKKDPVPQHCFEAACSTIFPCYPQYLAKYADRDKLDSMINNACIVSYR